MPLKIAENGYERSKVDEYITLMWTNVVYSLNHNNQTSSTRII